LGVLFFTMPAYTGAPVGVESRPTVSTSWSLFQT
jgi:hypothetical protein